MHQEVIESSPILRYAIPIAAALIAADGLYTFSIGRISLPVAALIFALTAVLLWLSLQFATFYIYADREGVFLAFVRLQRQILRRAIRSARPFKVSFWNAGGLWIRRGFRYEGWIARTGKGLSLELADGKKFVFSCERPEAVIKAIKSKS